MSAIRFENVTKEFPNQTRPAVNHCTLAVDQGQFVVLLGPSGCGKTTLLKMVNRLYEPSSGTIYLDGVDIRQMSGTTLRRQIGYVIQQGGLFPHMTVAQNISVVPQLLRWDKAKIRARVDELLTLVDLAPAEYRERYPAQLSGGQQQRVGVARALAGNPDYILMDEPFGAVDAITRNSLQEEILILQRKLRKTILFVTHDVEEALRLADKIVMMRAGEVVQYATPLHMLNHPADAFVNELIGGDDIVRQLGLVRVAAAMGQLPPHFQVDGQPTVDRDTNLRLSLSTLLRTNAPALVVVEQRRPVGLLTLDHIKAATEKNDHEA